MVKLASHSLPFLVNSDVTWRICPLVVYVFLLSRLPTLWRFILAGYFSNALYTSLPDRDSPRILIPVDWKNFLDHSVVSCVVRYDRGEGQHKWIETLRVERQGVEGCRLANANRDFSSGKAQLNSADRRFQSGPLASVRSLRGFTLKISICGPWTLSLRLVLRCCILNISSYHNSAFHLFMRISIHTVTWVCAFCLSFCSGGRLLRLG